MLMNPVVVRARAIPSVDRLLKLEAAEMLVRQHGRPLMLDTVRAVLDEYRDLLAKGGSTSSRDDAELIARCTERLRATTANSLRPVFNLTGTVLHTNLGRAVMPRCAAEAVMQAMTHPVNLEFDLGGAARGERDSHVERRLVELTGAQAATVVNNNAAAVYLALNTLALRKEVIVSRGELIEIGGAFRVPDIMARAGCKLREVGTTNRTHPGDYIGAIGPRTGALMKVHASNYAIQGFVASVPEIALARIAHERALPLIIDLGSGTLVDLEKFGLPHEPTPRETLARGADIVTFSGDKLLGGPQCGLIVGRKDLIAKIKSNPMKRALRVDKMTLAALEAILKLYSNPDRLPEELPTLASLTRHLGAINEQARRVLPPLVASLGERFEATIVDCMSQVGSGSLPIDTLPSVGLALRPRRKRTAGATETLAMAFRALPIPVIGRIKDRAFLLDLRCLDDEAGFIAQLNVLDLYKTVATMTPP